VFEPNDPTLWSSLTINIWSFLSRVYRSGALFGANAQQAFYVKCDAESNPPEVIEAGQVVCEIGICPVKPAEFVIFRPEPVHRRRWCRSQRRVGTDVL
jgi:hypothetical protein